jgi:hypothetical protein
MPSPPSRGRSSPPALTDALTSAAGYAAAEKAAATRRAYRAYLAFLVGRGSCRYSIVGLYRFFFFFIINFVSAN